MTDSRFNKGIEEIKALGMTAAEKSALFERVMATTKSPEPVKSPWTAYSFSSWIMRHRVVSASIAVILVVVLTGGGVASASMRALPGDAFYGVKIHVVEPLRVALASTPAAKAQVEVELANTRIEEAQTLAAQGKLDQKTEDEIAGRITVHAEALGEELKKVKEHSSEEADNISHGFEVSALARIHALQTLSVHNASATSSGEKNQSIEHAVRSSVMNMHIETSASSTISTENKNEDKSRDESTHSNKVEVHSNIPFMQNADGSIDASTSNPNGSSDVHVEINQSNSSSHASVQIDQHINEASVIQAIPVQLNLGHGQGRGKDK